MTKSWLPFELTDPSAQSSSVFSGTEAFILGVELCLFHFCMFHIQMLRGISLFFIFLGENILTTFGSSCIFLYPVLKSISAISLVSIIGNRPLFAFSYEIF